LVLGSSSATPAQPTMDPRLMIAQAAVLVREGKPEQAAQWLASAARNAANPADAIQLAIAGAASFRQAGKIADASALLRETSLARFEDDQAATLHLQSSILIADIAAPDLIVEQLEECVTTWPKDSVAPVVTDWLIRLQVARSQPLEAARASTRLDASLATEARIKQAGLLWGDAIFDVAPVQRDVMAQDAIRELERFGANDARVEVNGLAILFRDRVALASIPSDAIIENWHLWLLSVRTGREAGEIEFADSVSEAVRLAAMDRLLLDGYSSLTSRRSLAGAILKLTGGDDSLRSAESLGWMNQWPQAIAMFKRLIAKSPADLVVAKQAAGILSGAQSPDAKREGLRLWSEISSRLPQGSAGWHEAKLAVIGTLRSTGDIEQSKRLANFVWMTQKPSEPELAKKYEAAR